MATVKTTFRPGEHGFRFVNSFEFSLDFELPFVGKIDLEEMIIGLCGGMCFAALDYFHAGIPAPLDGRVPERDTPLYAYLAKRQLDSFAGPVVPLRVMEWMLRGDNDVAQTTFTKEFPKLRRRITNGHPAVLVLVRAGGISNPTQNHQVVATGYEIDEFVRNGRITLYDPNWPGLEPYIALSMDPSGQVRLSQSTGEPLRGFFVLDYSPRKRGLPQG